MLNKITLVLFIFFFSSCSQNIRNKVCNNCIHSFCLNVYQDKKLFLLGSGGFGKEKIQEFSLIFKSPDKYDIDKARFLIVELTESFLSCINNDLSLREFLIEHPFDLNMLDIGVLFLDENEDFVSLPHIASVYVLNGIVTYSIYNESKDNLKMIHDESYRRAKGIVEHQMALQNLNQIQCYPSEE